MIGLPAGIFKQGGNTAITVAAVLTGKLGHIRHQSIFTFLAPGDVFLGRSMLPQDAAGPALRYHQMFTDMMDELAATLPGSEVYPGSLREDEFIEGQVRNRSS